MAHHEHWAGQRCRKDSKDTDAEPGTESRQKHGPFETYGYLAQRAWAETEEVTREIEAYWEEHFEQLQRHCWKLIKETAEQQAKIRDNNRRQKQRPVSQKDCANWGNANAEDHTDRTQRHRENGHEGIGSDQFQWVRGMGGRTTVRQRCNQANLDKKLVWMDSHHNHTPERHLPPTYTHPIRYANYEPQASRWEDKQSGRIRGRSPTTRNSRSPNSKPATHHKHKDADRWDTTDYSQGGRPTRRQDDTSKQPTLQHYQRTIRDIWSGPIERERPRTLDRGTVGMRNLKTRSRDTDTQHNHTRVGQSTRWTDQRDEPTLLTGKATYIHSRSPDSRSPRHYQREANRTQKLATITLQSEQANSRYRGGRWAEQREEPYRAPNTAPTIARGHQEPPTPTPPTDGQPTLANIDGEQPTPISQREREKAYANIWAQMEEEGLVDHHQTHRTAAPSEDQPQRGNPTQIHRGGRIVGKPTAEIRENTNTHLLGWPHDRLQPPRGGENYHTNQEYRAHGLNVNNKTLTQRTNALCIYNDPPHIEHIQNDYWNQPPEWDNRNRTQPPSTQQERYHTDARNQAHQTKHTLPRTHMYRHQQEHLKHLNTYSNTHHVETTINTPGTAGAPHGTLMLSNTRTQYPNHRDTKQTTTQSNPIDIKRTTDPPTPAPLAMRHTETRKEVNADNPQTHKHRLDNQDNNPTNKTSQTNRGPPDARQPCTDTPGEEVTWTKYKDMVWKALHAYGRVVETHHWQEYCSKIQRALHIANRERERPPTPAGQHTNATPQTTPRQPDPQRRDNHMTQPLGQQENTEPRPQQLNHRQQATRGNHKTLGQNDIEEREPRAPTTTSSILKEDNNNSRAPRQHGDTHQTIVNTNTYTTSHTAYEEQPAAQAPRTPQTTTTTNNKDTSTTGGQEDYNNTTRETATPQLTYRTALRQAWIWKTRHAQNTLEEEPFLDRENINYYTNIRAGPPAYLTEEQRQTWITEMDLTKEKCRKSILMPAIAEKTRHWHELRLQTPAPQAEKKKAITEIFREVWSFWLKKGMRNRDARKILKKADLYAEFTPAPPPIPAGTLENATGKNTCTTQTTAPNTNQGGPETIETGDHHDSKRRGTEQAPRHQEHNAHTPLPARITALESEESTQATDKPDHATHEEHSNITREPHEQRNHPPSKATQEKDTPKKKADTHINAHTDKEPLRTAQNQTQARPQYTRIEQTHESTNTTSTTDLKDTRNAENPAKPSTREAEEKKTPAPPTGARGDAVTTPAKHIDNTPPAPTERNEHRRPLAIETLGSIGQTAHSTEHKDGGTTTTRRSSQQIARHQPPYTHHHIPPPTGGDAEEPGHHPHTHTHTRRSPRTHPVGCKPTDQGSTERDTTHTHTTTETTPTRQHKNAPTPKREQITPRHIKPPKSHKTEHKEQQQAVETKTSTKETGKEDKHPTQHPQSPKPIRVETPSAHYRNSTNTPKARKQPTPHPRTPDRRHPTQPLHSPIPDIPGTPNACHPDSTLPPKTQTQHGNHLKSPTKKGTDRRKDTQDTLRGPIVAIDLTREDMERGGKGDWTEQWEDDIIFFTPERTAGTPKTPSQRTTRKALGIQMKTPPQPLPPVHEPTHAEHKEGKATTATTTNKEKDGAHSKTHVNNSSNNSSTHTTTTQETHTQQNNPAPSTTPDKQEGKHPNTSNTVEVLQTRPPGERTNRTNPAGTSPHKTQTNNKLEKDPGMNADPNGAEQDSTQTQARPTNMRTPDRPTQKDETPEDTVRSTHTLREHRPCTVGQRGRQQTQPQRNNELYWPTPPTSPKGHHRTLSDISLDFSIPDTPTLLAQLEEAQDMEEKGYPWNDHTERDTMGQSEHLGTDTAGGHTNRTHESGVMLERLSQMPTVPDSLAELHQTQIEEATLQNEHQEEVGTEGPNTKPLEIRERTQRLSQMQTIPDTLPEPNQSQSEAATPLDKIQPNTKRETTNPTLGRGKGESIKGASQGYAMNRSTPTNVGKDREPERDEEEESKHTNLDQHKDMRRNRLRNLWKKYTKEKKKTLGSNTATDRRSKPQEQQTPSTVYDYTIKGLTTAEKQVLGLGKSFIITQNAIDIDRIKTDIATYIRRLRLHYIFRERKADRAQHNLDLNRAHRLIQKDKPQKNTSRIQWRKQKSTFQPEETQRDINQIERNMETNIATQLTNRKLATPNIPQDWKKAIESLKTRIAEREITITQADKGGGIIAVDYNTYMHKGTKYIEEEAGAYTLEHTPEEKLITTLKKERDKITKQLKDTDTIPTDTATYATHQTIEKITGMKFYYKIHKTTVLKDMPVRPLQSCIHSPTQHLSQILTDIYKPYVDNTRIPTYIRDTNHTLYELDGVHLRDTDTLAIADVVALYPSIEHEKGLKAIEEFTKEHMYKDEKKIQALVNAFKIVITQNYVKWNGKIYKQTRGVAMGTPVAVTYANIYMSAIDQRLATTYPHIRLHRRFIDDNLFIIPSSEKEEFGRVLNTLDPPALKYTVEYLGDPPHADTLPFLDITFYLSEHREIYTRLYTKQTDKHQYLLPHSQHPRHIIRNIPRGVFARIRRLCKTDTAYREDSDKAIGWLKDRGYKESILTQIRDETANRCRWAMIKEIEDREERKNERGTDTCTTTQIPFINTYSTPTKGFNNTLKAQHKTLDNLFKKARMKPLSAYRRKPNLGDMLIQPSLRIPIEGETRTPKTFEKCGKHLHTKPCPCTKRHSRTLCRLCAHIAQEEIQVKTRITRPITCDSKNLIYMIWCDTCSKAYIGETQQKLRDRFTQHLKNLNALDQDLYNHFQIPGHRAGRMKIAVLETLPTDEPLYRKMKESSWIRKLRTYTPHGLNEKMKESPLDAIER